MDADMWASLPCDLLVGILSRLGSTAVLSSAGTCRSWRRAIIANASFLGRHPALLLGFFHSHKCVYRHTIPRSPANVLTATDAVVTKYPAWSSSSKAKGPFASRDGFVLLAGGGSGDHRRLRLFDARSGIRRILPAAALDVSVDSASYVLVTGRFLVSRSSAVWILAVKRGKKEDVKPGMTYQIFSPVSGAWGLVKRSARLGEGRAPAYMYGEPKDVVVSRDCTVYWLGESMPYYGSRRRVVFALNVLTERAWVTELPEKYVELDSGPAWRKPLFSLAASDDGCRPSVIASLVVGFKLEVWELAGDDGRRWTLRRTINDVRRVLPPLRRWWNGKRTKTGRQVRVTCFCPRIGCLFGTADEDRLVLLIPIYDDRSSSRLIGDKHHRVSCYPYEMDWLIYVSRMKYF